MAEVVVKNGLEDVNFFGKFEQGAEYPGYYNKHHVEILEEEVNKTDRLLKTDRIPEKDKPTILAEYRRNKERLDEIKGAKPVLTGQLKDALAKIATTNKTGELGGKIKETMFTYSEMQRGSDGGADGHQEYERQTEPCVKLSGDEIILAKKFNCKISNDGMVSRNDAIKVWKICRSIMGEDTNADRVLRDRR